MEKLLYRSVDRLLAFFGLDASADSAKIVAALLVIMAIAALIGFVLCFVLSFFSGYLSRLSSGGTKYIFIKKNIRKISFSVAILIFYLLAPLSYADRHEHTVLIAKKMLDCMMVIAVLSLSVSFFRVVFEILSRRKSMQNRPLKGLLQITLIIAYVVGFILIVSIIIGKSPSKLLAGLGAFAAVVSLIFKNIILGIVSGVQLADDEMMSIGDWIVMQQYDIDGMVEEITLNTVKVRNFDNSVVTVPPFLLTSEAFQNWSAMLRSGGRRIMRSVNIDMNSIRFCTVDYLQKLSKLDLMSGFTSDFLNSGGGDEPDLNRIGQLTNLGVFRVYLIKYVELMPQLNRTMKYMIRTLNPSELGVPLQLYLYSVVTEWKEYENIQSSLFEHVIAMVPYFDLRIYQRPSDGSFVAIGCDVKDNACKSIDSDLS